MEKIKKLIATYKQNLKAILKAFQAFWLTATADSTYINLTGSWHRNRKPQSRKVGNAPTSAASEVFT